VDEQAFRFNERRDDHGDHQHHQAHRSH
jgi:hypothetical protein